MEENGVQLQAEISRLNQALIEKENFLKEYETKIAGKHNGNQSPKKRKADPQSLGNEEPSGKSAKTSASVSVANSKAASASGANSEANSDGKDDDGTGKGEQKAKQGKKPFKCNDCDAAFSQEGSLKMHIAAVHEAKKPFKYNIYTTQKGNLKRHCVDKNHTGS